MKENKEETKLQSEQKTVEVLLKQACMEFFYYWWNEPGNNTEQGFDKWIQTEDGKQFAAQFKSQLPINQNMLNLIKEADAWLSFNTSPSAEQIMQFRKSLQEVIAAESQLPIERTDFEGKLPKLPYHFDRNGKPKYQSQPLPIEQKPDFEAIADKWSDHACIHRKHLKEHYAKAFEAGMHVCWRDYVKSQPLPIEGALSELKQEFVDYYVKRREYQNMEDSLRGMFDKFVLPHLLRKK